MVIRIVKYEEDKNRKGWGGKIVIKERKVDRQGSIVIHGRGRMI